MRMLTLTLTPQLLVCSPLTRSRFGCATVPLVALSRLSSACRAARICCCVKLDHLHKGWWCGIVCMYACVHVCLELVLTAVCACLQLHHHPIRPPSRCIGLHCYCELQCEQALHLSHAFPPRTRKFSGWSGRRMHLPLKSMACDAVHLQIPSTHAASSVHHKCRGACG